MVKHYSKSQQRRHLLKNGCSILFTLFLIYQMCNISTTRICSQMFCGVTWSQAVLFISYVTFFQTWFPLIASFNLWTFFFTKTELHRGGSERYSSTSAKQMAKVGARLSSMVLQYIWRTIWIWSPVSKMLCSPTKRSFPSVHALQREVALCSNWRYFWIPQWLYY
mgnify:CR=1 FL=1